MKDLYYSTDSGVVGCADLLPSKPHSAKRIIKFKPNDYTVQLCAFEEGIACGSVNGLVTLSKENEKTHEYGQETLYQPPSVTQVLGMHQIDKSLLVGWGNRKFSLFCHDEVDKPCMEQTILQPLAEDSLLTAMAINKLSMENLRLATVGDQDDLKVYDVNKPDTPMFVAKNVRNSWLDLRVPLGCTDVTFFRDNPNLVSYCGRHGDVRFFDIRSEGNRRRPICRLVPKPAVSWSRISDVPKSTDYPADMVLVGDTIGNLQLFDLRKIGTNLEKAKCCAAFKGVGGSVRHLEFVTPTLFMSASLDAHIRFHMCTKMCRDVVRFHYTKFPVSAVFLNKESDVFLKLQSNEIDFTTPETVSTEQTLPLKRSQPIECNTPPSKVVKTV